MGVSTVDWQKLEEIIEKAVRKSRVEETKDFTEAIKMLAEYVKKGYEVLEEHSRRIEELIKRVEEQGRRLEEIGIAIKEHSKRLEDLGRLVTIVANRFGILSEESSRAGMRYVVEEVFGVAKVERWVYRDDEGFVYGYPTTVEVDVVIRDKEHILIEIKSRVSKGDIAEIFKIGKLYEKVEKVKPKLVIIGGFIDEDVYDLAKNLGVEIRPAIRI